MILRLLGLAIDRCGYKKSRHESRLSYSKEISI